MNLDKLIEELETHCLAAVPVGSRVTVSPPPMDTDCDILCRCEDYDMYYDFTNILTDKDWKEEGEYGHMEFSSWRNILDDTNYNLILTYNEDFFDKFLEATVQCKKLNLQTKAERIALFDKVMGKKSKPKKILLGSFGMASPVNMNQLVMDFEHYQAQYQQAAQIAAAQGNPYLQGAAIHDAVYYDANPPVEF